LHESKDRSTLFNSTATAYLQSLVLSTTALAEFVEVFRQLFGASNLNQSSTELQLRFKNNYKSFFWFLRLTA
jgi:hypothetical protein